MENVVIKLNVMWQYGMNAHAYELQYLDSLMNTVKKTPLGRISADA
jgi:hypothetical protein